MKRNNLQFTLGEDRDNGLIKSNFPPEREIGQIVPKLYLAHPTLDRAYVKDLEKSLTKQLKIDLLNPFYYKDREDIKNIDIGKAREFEADAESAKRLVELDLENVLQCDGLLGIITKKAKAGTFMEIFYNSSVLKRPTFLVIEDDDLIKHPWLQYFSDERFSSIDEFKEAFPRIHDKIIYRRISEFSTLDKYNNWLANRKHD